MNLLLSHHVGLSLNDIPSKEIIGQTDTKDSRKNGGGGGQGVDVLSDEP